MAGGIFVDQPFHMNPKCVFYSGVMMTLYWFFYKKPNIYLLPVIFVISYVSMAWYDYQFNCDIMYSGSAIGPNTIDAIFKPQHRGEDKGKKNLSENQESEYLRRVYLFHIIAVAPLLIYVGYYGRQANVKLFPVVMAVGIIALIYHGLRVVFPRSGHQH